MNQAKGKKSSTLKSLERAEIQKEIDEVYATINEDQGDYDKQLLTLSSGFLAVSLAFIKDIVPLKDAAHLWILYLSFILLAFCVLSVLFSYQFSIAGLFKAKEYWDKLLIGEKDAKFPYVYAHRIKIVNRISGFFFLLGVSSLVFFVILNLDQEAKMTNDRARTNDGAYVKVPSSNVYEERGSYIKAPPAPPPPEAPPAITSQNSGESGGNNQTKKP